MAIEVVITGIHKCAYCENILSPGDSGILDGYKGERAFCDEFCLSDYRMHKDAKSQTFKKKSLDAMLNKFATQFN